MMTVSQTSDGVAPRLSPSQEVPFDEDPLLHLDQRLETVGEAFWIPPRQLFVVEPTAAKAVLANEGARFEEHSDFFHTRLGIYGPREVQVEIGRRGRRLLTGYLEDHRGELPGRIEEIVGAESSWPDTANRLVFRHLAPTLAAADRPALLHRRLREVLERGVLAGAPANHSGLSRWIFRKRLYRLLGSLVEQDRAMAPDAAPSEDPAPPRDLLQLVSRAAGPEIPAAAVAEWYLAFVFAMAGSVGFALAWSVYLLGRHPETRESRPGWIVREALRLYPVAWLLARRPAVAHQLAGVAVTPEDEVIVCPYALHRHPAHWHEPRAFRPERWGETPAPAAYLPFGWGPRTCAAASLTLGLVADILELLLDRSSLTIDAPTDLPHLGPALAPPSFRLLRTPLAGARGGPSRGATAHERR